MAQPKGTIAPLGTAFTYQGELKSAGNPATGLFDFEVCLFTREDPADTTPLFCHLVNDQPLEPGGRFTLHLDFGPQFDGGARFLEIRVRPGDDAGAYTPLQPRQAIRATPEALRAASTPWTGISGMPAGFADNVDNVGITSLSAGSGLTTNAAEPGAGNPITASGVLSIRGGGIDATMIAPGAIGVAQIDPSQVQARVSGSCAAGEFLRGIAANGAVDCALLPSPFNQVLDQTGDVGSELSLALRSDDRPVLAYYSATNASLKYYNCFDRACTSGSVRTLDSPGDVGRSPSIALDAAGRPLIAYFDDTNDALKLYVCANVECTSGSSRIVDNSVLVTPSVAMMIRPDGRPLIAYANATNFAVRVFDCADADCSGGVSRQVATGMSIGSGLAVVADPAGFPVVVKGGNAGSSNLVSLVRCADAGCVSASQTNFDSSYAMHVDVVMRASGLPLVATSGIGSNVSIHNCTSSSCDARTSYLISSNWSERVSLAMAGTLPRVAFRRVVDAEQAYLRLHACETSACNIGATRTLDGNVGDAVGGAADIAIRSDGRPVIAHYDSLNDELLLHICANPDCT